jgi:hypothetical protein
MPQSFAEQLRSIPMSPSLGQSLERAHRSARDQSHRFVTLEHLLLALTEDAEAGLILEAANVDLSRLGTDVSGYLGRLLEDMRAEPGTEPRPDGELLRVLQAAASAAQQSRRRQIDGAIVLAAIVGDGKSAAAGLLKALGMTFEEAIRALQRANTRARLKPLARAPSASSPAPGEASLPPTVGAEVQSGRDLPLTQPAATASAQSPSTQSADEILAAARARIQKRSLAAAAKAEGALIEPPPAPLPTPTPPAQVVDNEPQIETVDPAQTKSLTAAIEAAMTSPSPPRKAEPRLPPTVPSVRPPPGDLPPPAPAASSPAVSPRAAFSPAPDAKAEPQAPTLSSLPPAGRVPQPPFPARPVQRHEGPRRPPLPSLPAASPPQPGIANRPGHAPWPGADGRPPGGRPPLANGGHGEFPPLVQHVPERPDLAHRRGVPPRAPMPGEKGLLIEAVPRRMRVGAAAGAEVRIARDKIDGLLLALKNRDGQVSGEAPLVRALSVRLKGAKGGFWIEPTTPETQWIDGQRARAEDDHIVWRWTVVPRRRGRGRLTVMVTVNTAGRDGVVVTTSPPDRVIDVRVGLNQVRRVLRVAGWIMAGLAGAVLARFGAQYWPLVSAVFSKTLGS